MYKCVLITKFVCFPGYRDTLMFIGMPDAHGTRIRYINMCADSDAKIIMLLLE